MATRRAIFGLAALALPLAALALFGRVQASSSQPAPSQGPRYDTEGRLLRPEGYERWVYVGASLGLSYSEHARPGGPGTFHHVYLEPWAYDELARTGQFPEGTRLVLEIHQTAERSPPSLQGYFEGERLAVEVAVKDSKTFEEGWAYFDFSNGKTASRAFAPEQCFRCHQEHAAQDNVFTQFYPVLRRLERHGA